MATLGVDGLNETSHKTSVSSVLVTGPTVTQNSPFLTY